VHFGYCILFLKWYNSIINKRKKEVNKMLINYEDRKKRVVEYKQTKNTKIVYKSEKLNKKELLYKINSEGEYWRSKGFETYLAIETMQGLKSPISEKMKKYGEIIYKFNTLIKFKVVDKNNNNCILYKEYGIS
jgi:hypothetical protein